MIDSATNWFEIKATTEKSSLNVMDSVEQAWLSRYSWPDCVTCDRGTEFLKDFASTTEADCGVLKHSTTVRNPRANFILERVHQMLGNLIRTCQLHESGLTGDEA